MHRRLCCLFSNEIESSINFIKLLWNWSKSRHKKKKKIRAQMSSLHKQTLLHQIILDDLGSVANILEKKKYE